MIDEVLVICDVPIPSPEAVTQNEDGTYTIFISPNLSFEQQQKAYLHALKHIANDFNGGDVQEIEAKAHADDT